MRACARPFRLSGPSTRPSHRADETSFGFATGPKVRPAPAASFLAVRLSPADKDKLLLATAGMVARDRRARGVKLNHPETVALLSCWVIEGARDGRSVAELMAGGRRVLTREDVMEGVPEMVAEVQVEATFRDGRKLVTLHEPVA
ncbi:MAG: urease subunit gamma [Solirubrobacteraceae bacterium]|nr:urease subunit gamma [Solirubrobacteraceae bacterium]